MCHLDSQSLEPRYICTYVCIGEVHFTTSYIYIYASNCKNIQPDYMISKELHVPLHLVYVSTSKVAGHRYNYNGPLFKQVTVGVSTR